MATRNIVPRANGEGSIGTAAKHWGAGHFDTLPNWQEYLEESTGYGIVSGFGISINGMSIVIDSGVAHLNSGTRNQINSKTVQLDAANNTYPRKDLIYIDTQGNINVIKGELGSAAIKGKRAYTVTTNFATNDKLRLGLNVTKDLTMIAGTDFQAGGSISVSVSNLAAALNSNEDFNAIYTAQSDNNILTVVEKSAGNYDTPGELDVLAGSGVVTMGTPVYSTPEDANAPALPNGGILVATAFINAGATEPIIYSYERFNKDNIPASVLKFGAIPNDVSNDIGDAILAMASAGYRHIFIPAGTYYISKECIIPNTIDSLTSTGCTIVAINAMDRMFRWHSWGTSYHRYPHQGEFGAYAQRVSGIVFDGNFVAKSAIALGWMMCIESCKFFNFTAITLDSTSINGELRGEETWIDNCQFWNSALISRKRNDLRNAIAIRPLSDSMISNCYFTGYKYCIYGGSGADELGNIVVNHCYFFAYRHPDGSVAVYKDTYTPSLVMMTNCYFDGMREATHNVIPYISSSLFTYGINEIVDSNAVKRDGNQYYVAWLDLPQIYDERHDALSNNGTVKDCVFTSAGDIPKAFLETTNVAGWIDTLHNVKRTQATEHILTLNTTYFNTPASEGYQIGHWYKCGEIKSSNIENVNLRIALTYNSSVFKVRDYYAEISGYGTTLEANTNFPYEVITFGYKKHDGKIDLFCKKTNTLTVSAILLDVVLNYMNPNLVLYPYPEVTSADNITQFTFV